VKEEESRKGIPKGWDCLLLTGSEGSRGWRRGGGEESGLSSGGSTTGRSKDGDGRGAEGGRRTTGEGTTELSGSQ
jgi:hypothetical protein